MKKQIIFIILTLTLMTGTLFADKLSDVINSKTLKVGMIGNNKPFIYKNRLGKTVGFEIDIINAVAVELGVKVSFSNVNKNKIIKFIDTNKVDIVLGSIIHTNKLDKKIDFSITYFFNGQSLLGKKSLTAFDMDSMINKRIGVIKNSINFKVLEVIQPLAKLIKFRNHTNMLSSLSNGQIDAISSNYGYLLNVAKSQNNDFKIIGNPYTVEPYGLLLKENESNFRDRINLSLENIVKSGEYNTIYKKWFKKNPVRNITLWP